MIGLQPISPVIKNLMIINVLVWIAELTFKEPLVYHLSMHYVGHPDFGIWQILTYMFLHSFEFQHVFFNMLMLYFFGTTLENMWGGKRFLLFYLICGVGAGIIQLMAGRIEMFLLDSQLANGSITEFVYIEKGRQVFNGIVLGASGAVMGVTAGFTYLFPNTSVMLFPLPIPIKVKYLFVFYIAGDLFGGLNPQTTSNIAHFAHIGGALVGFILVITMNKNNRRTFY
jgi:membrane associated rhomboid family serine protease